jgi:hypothetical protein
MFSKENAYTNVNSSTASRSLLTSEFLRPLPPLRPSVWVRFTNEPIVRSQQVHHNQIHQPFFSRLLFGIFQAQGQRKTGQLCRYFRRCSKVKILFRAAETALGAAETALGAAETALGAAETALFFLAETALGAAETALRATTETALRAAETALRAAETALGAAETALRAAETALRAAETALRAAGTALSRCHQTPTCQMPVATGLPSDGCPMPHSHLLSQMPRRAERTKYIACKCRVSLMPMLGFYKQNISAAMYV